MTSSASGQSSLNIHYTLLDVAEEVLKSASALEQQGSLDSLAGGRVRCASALLLACSALEACINVFAGLYYEGPGKSCGPVWPCTNNGRSWHWHSLTDKWRQFAAIFCGGSLPATSGWETRLISMSDQRNELVAHFKGAWGANDLDQRYRALTAASVGDDVQFARDLVNALHHGYEAKHGSLFYSATPLATTPGPQVIGPPWAGLPAGPIGTAGKDRVEPL